MKNYFFLFGFCLFFLAGSSLAWAATYTVTNSDDTGDNSLRWAVTEANSNDGENTIVFQAGLGTITLSSAITLSGDRTYIDGDIDDDNVPDVIIVGLGTSAHHGFIVEADNCTIDGFVIQNFDSGIRLNGANSNTITNCYIGTDSSGESAAANKLGVFLRTASAYNEIGPNNVISGNQTNGIEIKHPGTNSNEVFSNMIGTDKDGLTALPNGGSGIIFSFTAEANVIGGMVGSKSNIISGNTGNGISLEKLCNYNIIKGNYIGVNANGAVLGNNTGISITQGSSYNQIGGDSLLEANTIGGSDLVGIGIYPDADYQESLGNEIKYNYIGTNASGADLGNKLAGVLMTGGLYPDGDQLGTYNYQVKQTVIGPGNVIANNADGPYDWQGFDVTALAGAIVLAGQEVDDNQITQNSFYNNTVPGIIFINGANASVAAPVISSLDYSDNTLVVSGTANAGASVEIYQSSANSTGSSSEGEVYLGAATATGGTWSATITRSNMATREITALAYYGSNTSEFADSFPVSAESSTTTTTLAPGSPVISNFFINGIRPNDGDTISAQPTVTGTIADNSQITDVVLTVNDESVSNMSGLSTSQVDFSHAFSSSLASGTYTFGMTATDDDNNVTTDTISNLVVRGGDVEVLSAPVATTRIFNPGSGQIGTIAYSLSRDANIILYVFDLNGRLIKETQYLEGQNGGRGGLNQVNWDGRDNAGQLVANGVYIYKLTSGSRFIASGRIAVKR
ncbi:MAG: hypothetical protein ABH823_04810 [bacterium]